MVTEKGLITGVVQAIYQTVNLMLVPVQSSPLTLRVGVSSYSVIGHSSLGEKVRRGIKHTPNLLAESTSECGSVGKLFPRDRGNLWKDMCSFICESRGTIGTASDSWLAHTRPHGAFQDGSA